MRRSSPPEGLRMPSLPRARFLALPGSKGEGQELCNAGFSEAQCMGAIGAEQYLSILEGCQLLTVVCDDIVATPTRAGRPIPRDEFGAEAVCRVFECQYLRTPRAVRPPPQFTGRRFFHGCHMLWLAAILEGGGPKGSGSHRPGAEYADEGIYVCPEGDDGHLHYASRTVIWPSQGRSSNLWEWGSRPLNVS